MAGRHQVSHSHKLAGLAAGPRVIDLVVAMIRLTEPQGQGIIATYRPKLDTLNFREGSQLTGQARARTRAGTRQATGLTRSSNIPQRPSMMTPDSILYNSHIGGYLQYLQRSTFLGSVLVASGGLRLHRVHRPVDHTRFARRRIIRFGICSRTVPRCWFWFLDRLFFCFFKRISLVMAFGWGCMIAQSPGIKTRTRTRQAEMRYGRCCSYQGCLGFVGQVSCYLVDIEFSSKQGW